MRNYYDESSVTPLDVYIFAFPLYWKLSILSIPAGRNVCTFDFVTLIMLYILSSQVVSLPCKSVILEVANFCAAMDTLIDQDECCKTNVITFTQKKNRTEWIYNSHPHIKVYLATITQMLEHFCIFRTPTPWPKVKWGWCRKLPHNRCQVWGTETGWKRTDTPQKAIAPHWCKWYQLTSYSASHNNWCTVGGDGDVGSARYELALLPPCPTIKVLSYSN